MKQNFEVDIDDYESLTETIKKLVRLRNKIETPLHKGRAKTLEKNRIIIENKYNIAQKILQEDIDKYFDKSNDLKEFYVYAHCNPTKKLNVTKDHKDLIAAEMGLSYRPFYIGKGIGDRCFNTNRNDSYRKVKQQINKRDKEIVIEKIEVNLYENEALAFEAKLIEIFGLVVQNRKNWLVNLDQPYKNCRLSL